LRQVLAALLVGLLAAEVPAVAYNQGASPTRAAKAVTLADLEPALSLIAVFCAPVAGGPGQLASQGASELLCVLTEALPGAAGPHLVAVAVSRALPPFGNSFHEALHRVRDDLGNCFAFSSFAAFARELASIETNRARWMDPGVGRFASVDPYQGTVADPATLHRYLYAAASPLDKCDPSGLNFDLPNMMASLAVAGRVAAFALNIVGAVLNTVHAVLYGSSAIRAFREGDPDNGLGYALAAVITGGLAALNVLGIKSFLARPPSLGFSLVQVSMGPNGGNIFLTWVEARSPAVAQWAEKELLSALIGGLGITYYGTPADARRKVMRGQGPRGVSRIDRPNQTGDQWHAHNGPGEGSDAVNLDGSARHGNNSWLTNVIRKFLAEHGWDV
jgi:RHS repeat-associated protein